MSRDERTVVFQLPTVISGQLACIEGTVAGRSWPLSAGTFVIGRLPSSDLPLPQEPGVSKVHAKIVAEGDRYTLIDAESRNGTIVNGQPVQRVTLKDGDEIRVCGCVLRFTQTGGGPPSVKNQPVRAEGSITTERAFRPPPPTPPPVEPPRAEPPRPEQAVAAGPPAAAPPAPTSPGFAAASTEAWRKPAPAASSAAVEGPPGIATALEPPVELAEPLAAPKTGMGLFGYFATGLLLAAVVTGGAFAALRFLGDELLGPSSGASGDAQANASQGGAEAQGGEVARGDAGAPGRVALAGDEAAAAGAQGQGDEVQGGQAGDEQAGGEPAGGEQAGDEQADGAAGDTKLAAGAGEGSPAGEPGDSDDEPAPAAMEVWLPVSVSEPSPLVVRTRAGGKVLRVDVEDGARVERGQLLAELDEQADTAEIATLKESIRALESVAESQESAKEYLEQEKAKLQRLLAAQRNARITAPSSGTLIGFSLKQGDRLRSRQVVGKVRPDGGAVLSATVPKAAGKALKKGAPAKLRTDEGEELDGRVTSVRKKGESYTVTLDAGRADPRSIDEVRFP